MSREDGFTLIETMVGLTLTALVTVSVSGALATSTRIWARSDAGATGAEEARSTRQLESWISGSLPNNIYDLDDRTLFSGTPLSVEFVSENVPGPHGVGIAAIVLTVVPSERCPGAFDLTLRWTGLDPADRLSFGPSDSRILQSCHSHIGFSYFGRTQIEGAQGWSTDWTSSELPTLVRMDSEETGAGLMARLIYAPRPGTPYEDDGE
ncbi:MAG: type II secretory pathway pseudopilin PulG [Hyphomonas sp.]|jgi:type II secretory pathway pseudopilin PulG